jgi:hypothetical protein
MLRHLDVVPGDSKECDAFEKLRATDTYNTATRS